MSDVPEKDGEPRTGSDVLRRSEILEDLLTRAFEAIGRGEHVDISSLCSEHPQMAVSVAEALGRSGDLPRMHREAARIDAAIGTVLGGRYRLEERVGAGAMGVVYRATDQELGREVAVKLLRPELVVGAKMDVRLAREGEVLASIRHSGVVTVYDRGEAGDGRSYIVMELLRGCSVSRLLRGDGSGAVAASDTSPPTPAKRLANFRRMLGGSVALADNDVRQVASWVAMAAAGLHAAHAAEVVHRDVKPSNLFVEQDGRLIVVDFGIVSTGSHMTIGSDGSPMGTPAYMAPEQLDTTLEPDARTDVYGLAATLYHLVTGRAPFEGTVQQVLAAIGKVEPPRADQIRPGLPVDLVAIIEKGMSSDPAGRYQTAEELRQDLLAWLEFRPVSARRQSWLGRTWRKVRRSPQARAVAVVLVALAATAAWWSWSAGVAAAREDDLVAATLSVPPSLVNEMASYRATSGVSKSERVVKLLDRMVDLAADPGMPLALRIIHRSDRGDLAGAAADARRIVELGDAPFAALAAESYARGELPDALAQGKEPPVYGGANDRLLVVVHSMRCDDVSPVWVDSLLAGETRPGFAEVQLLVRMNRAAMTRGPAQLQAFRKLEAEVAQLEALRGGPSAIGGQVLLRGYLQQARREEARELATKSIVLAPDDYVLWLNGATASFRRGDHEGAVEDYRRAIELQPNSVRAHVMLSDVLIALEDFEQARAVIDGTPFHLSGRGEIRKAHQQGLLWFGLAWQARQEELAASEEPDESSESFQLAGRALAEFERERALSGETREIEEMLCDLMLGRSAPFEEMLLLLAKRPLDAHLLTQVSHFLPETLSLGQVDALAELFRRQAMQLDGRDG